MSYYHEVHVTLVPVGERATQELLKDISRQQNVQISYIIGFENELIGTFRESSLEAAKLRITHYTTYVAQYGWQVTRYKVEDTVVDSRYDDPLRLLHHDPLHPITA